MSLFSTQTSYPRYITTEKAVGETPLIALERARTKLGLPESVPLAYAGRLDPMASGKLLILIGEECKVQEKYHSFDKGYEVDLLLGTRSDSGDVLGILTPCDTNTVTRCEVERVFKGIVGDIALPYPLFSSKTVRGKPLHTWTLENRLDEIEIPVKKSRIYSLAYKGLTTLSRNEIVTHVLSKIETIPKVTDPQKELGADFRRDPVRASWNTFLQEGNGTYQIIRFSCIASSGTYMRSLSEVIAKKLGTCGLAYHIQRTKIGRYLPLTKSLGIWTRKF